MGKESGRYALAGGKTGYDRLLVLSRERWPDTQALFRRVGLGPGMRCLDVGCGGGAVTIEMARMVGPDGHVVGIDMDPVKVELAAKAAEEASVRNVTFRRQLVQDWSESDAYDAVYSRFLLQHLTDPRSLLRRMWAAVRPSGVLMVEDTDWTGWSADPPSPGIEFLRERVMALVQRRGGDARIGLKMARYFRESGATVSGVTLLSSLRTEPEGKRIAGLTLHVTAEALLAEKLASQDEIDAALADADRCAADPDSIMTGPKVFQVYGVRPSAPP